MKKALYDAPFTRTIEVRPNGMLLQSTGDVENMNPVQGSWDDDDD